LENIKGKLEDEDKVLLCNAQPKTYERRMNILKILSYIWKGANYYFGGHENLNKFLHLLFEMLY